MKRKEFLTRCGEFCLLGLGVPLLFQACKAIVYVPHSFSGNKLAVRKADFAENSFVVVATDRLLAPIYLSKRESGGYVAVLMRCTHRQCEVSPYGGYLHCPCHGSEFTKSGEVINGPASKDLHKFKVSENEQNIFIQLPA